MLKLIFCIRKREDLTEEEFFDYWLNSHGALVASHATAMNIRRYVQSHASERDLGQMITSGRGMEVPGFDGIAEIWWDSREDLVSALATQEGQAANAILVEDEARFIDLARSTIFFATEHPVFES